MSIPRTNRRWQRALRATSRRMPSAIRLLMAFFVCLIASSVGGAASATATIVECRDPNGGCRIAGQPPFPFPAGTAATCAEEGWCHPSQSPWPGRFLLTVQYRQQVRHYDAGLCIAFAMFDGGAGPRPVAYNVCDEPVDLYRNSRAVSGAGIVCQAGGPEFFGPERLEPGWPATLWPECSDGAGPTTWNIVYCADFARSTYDDEDASSPEICTSGRVAWKIRQVTLK